MNPKGSPVITPKINDEIYCRELTVTIPLDDRQSATFPACSLCRISFAWEVHLRTPPELPLLPPFFFQVTMTISTRKIGPLPIPLSQALFSCMLLDIPWNSSANQVEDRIQFFSECLSNSPVPRIDFFI